MVAKEAEETSGETSQINGGGKNVTKKKNKLNTNLQRYSQNYIIFFKQENLGFLINSCMILFTNQIMVIWM